MRAEPRLLFGYDADVAKWVAARIPHMHGGDFGPCVAIGVGSAERGTLYAGIVYHADQPDYGHIQLSMAADSPLWATPNTIRALLHYPFVQRGYWMTYTVTPLENERALKVNEHIGFKRKPIVPHAYGKKKHAQICQMTADDYGRKYGA